MSDKDQSSELPGLGLYDNIGYGIWTAQQPQTQFSRRNAKDLESKGVWMEEPLEHDPFQELRNVWRIPKHYSTPDTMIEKCLKRLFTDYPFVNVKQVGELISVPIVASLIIGRQIDDYVVFELPRHLSKVFVTS